MNNIISFFVLILSVLMVFIKIIIFESFDPIVCSEYLEVFFFLQFLTPLILVGSNYTSTKNSILSKGRNIEINSISILITLLPFILFSDALTIVGFLAFANALYYQNIELQKISGLYHQIIITRLIKPLMEISLLLLFYSTTKFDLAFYIFGEALLIICLTYIMKHYEKLKYSFFPRGITDFLKVLVLSVRSSSLRVFAPIFFSSNHSKIFLIFFMYEVYVQFASYLGTNALLKNNFKLIAKIYLILILSVPVQVAGLYLLTDFIFPVVREYIYYFPVYGCILFPQILFPLIIKQKRETLFFKTICVIVLLMMTFILLLSHSLLSISIHEYLKIHILFTFLESVFVIYIVFHRKSLS